MTIITDNGNIFVIIAPTEDPALRLFKPEKAEAKLPQNDVIWNKRVVV